MLNSISVSGVYDTPSFLFSRVVSYSVKKQKSWTAEGPGDESQRLCWAWPFLAELISLNLILLFCKHGWQYLFLLGLLQGFPGGSGEGNGIPHQYSCLENHFSLSCIGEGNGNPLQCSAWRIPGTEEPSGLLSMGSHRVGHD